MRREMRCLEAVLSAYRNGELEMLCAQRPLAVQWYLRKYAHPIAWNYYADATTSLASSLEVWLRWALIRCCPELSRELDRRLWLSAGSSRNFIALAVHFGLLTIPDFPDRYRARRDEPPFERLCGLWNIAPSSFYRYIERAKRQLADELFAPLHRDRLESLVRTALEFTRVRVSASEYPARNFRGSVAGSTIGDLCTLWRVIRDHDCAGILLTLADRASSLASYSLIDVLFHQIDQSSWNSADRVSFMIARGRIAGLQGRSAVESQWLSSALELASEANDTLSIARVYAARARSMEARDVDRAMADFRESIVQFDVVCESSGGVVSETERLSASIRLAWLYIQRNDPTALHIVQRCEAGVDESRADLNSLASLAQARAELSRRGGNRETAVAANLRALQFYDRLGNNAQTLRVCGTLVLLYGEMRQLALAESYAKRILGEPARNIDAHTRAATHLNLGVAYFWCDRIDHAISAYESALVIARGAGLQPLMGRAHYNIAESLYRRFALEQNAADEHFGDAHTRTSLEIWTQLGDKVALEATQNLKGAVLGLREHLVYDRMLPGELATHFEELNRIERLRQQIVCAETDESRAISHLAVAKEYLAIVVKERERALALMSGRPMSATVTEQLRALVDAFQHSLSLEEALIQRWQDESRGVVPQSKVIDLAKHLARSDTIKKSTYASICAVSPATASKHLALLAQSGLLQRANRGRATLFRRVDPS
jgi:tetratricopeptide (TPR) repeat protein